MDLRPKEWAEVMEPYTPEKVEEITGVPAEDLRQAARIYAQPPIPSKTTSPPQGEGTPKIEVMAHPAPS